MDINLKTSGNQNTGFVRVPTQQANSKPSLDDLIKRGSSNSAKNQGMDAKAMLAKLNVSSSQKVGPKFKFSETFIPPKKSEYEKLQAEIFKELDKRHQLEYDSLVLEELDIPINKGNIEKYKDIVREFSESTPLQIQQELEFLNDPKELFLLIKKNIQAIAISKNDDKVSSIFDRLINCEAIPNAQKEIDLEITKAVRNYKKLINLLTPRSKNPEVIQLEKDAVAMGVKKVNFSDDLQNAKMVNEVLKEFKVLGIPIPSKITVSVFTQSRSAGSELTAPLKKHSESHVFLPHSKNIQILKDLLSVYYSALPTLKQFQNSTPEMQEKLLEWNNNRVRNHSSTDNPKHSIYHEFAHAFQSQKIEDYLIRLSNEEMSIAKQISNYAVSLVSGREAMPEMFAKLMDGQQLTPEQRKLYLKLGGIIPRFKI